MAGSVGSDLDLALRIRALVEGQDAIVGLGTSFVDLNKRIESLIRGLKAITGSQEGAAKEFEYIASVADKYGRSLLDLSDNYIKLIASSKGTALEGAAVKEVFEAVSASMAVLGADTITTHRAFNALNQMMSKGQIYSEELKGQLAEAIPGALGILSRSLDISTQDMLRLMESGSLTADVLLPFARQLQKEFGNAAAESTTFSQSVDRLKNAWTLLMKQLGDTGAWKLLTSIIGALADSSTVLAGILGVGLASALQKAAIGLSTMAKNAYDSAKATLAGVGPAQQAAIAAVEQAEAQVAVTTANIQSLQAKEAIIRADIAAATTAQQAAAAQTRLAINLEMQQVAGYQAAKAADALAAAQARLLGTQSLWSKSMSFLAGPGGMIALMVAGFAAMALAFREQDDITKTIAKSTEDYAESLKKMSATAIAEAERRLDVQQREDRTLVASYQARIAGTQQAIESIQAEGDARRDAAQRIAEYNQQIIDDTLAMEKIQARIVDSDIKLADGRRALAAKSAELNASQQQLTASSEALSIKLEEERRIVADLQAQKAAGLDVDVQLQAAYKNLASTEGQLTANRGKLKLVTDDLKATTTGYAKALYDALSDSELVAISHQGQASAMDQLEQKVKKTVQSMLALDQQQRDLVAAGKLMKAQYDALEKTIGDMADIHLREANAIGDVVKQRQASVAQGDAQAELATRGLAIAENELRVSQARLEATQQELAINPKKKTALEKEISDLNVLIVSQQAETDKRRENVKATVLEAEARRQAIETTSESFARQQQQLQQSSADLLALKGLYRDLQESGAGLDALSAVFERIAAKEQEVALIAQSMGGIMSQAAKNVGQDWEEMTTGFDQKTRQMIDSLEQLALRGVLTGQQLRDSIANAINTANTKQELDSLGSALLNLFENGKIGAEELQLRYDEIRVKLEAIKTAADPTSQALAKLGIDVPKQLDSVAESARRTFDQLDRGQVTSLKLQEAFLVYAEAAVRAAEANGRQIDPALKAEAANLGLSQTLELLIEKYQRLSPEIESNIKYIERWKDGASDQVSAIEGIVKAKSSEIQSEIDVANAKGETDKARRLSRELMQQEADGAVLIAQAKVIEQNAEYALAVAKRNELELKVAKNEATQEELGLAALVAQKELAEAIAANAQVESLKVLADKLREINALRAVTNGPDGVQQNTKATKDNTAALNDNADATKNASESGSGLAKVLASQIQFWRDQTGALSEATRALFDFFAGFSRVDPRLGGNTFSEISSEARNAAREIDQLTTYVRAMNDHFVTSANDISDLFARINAAGASAKKAYYEQKLAAEELEAQIVKAGDSGSAALGNLDSTLKYLNDTTQASISSFALLNQQDLDQLRSALDEATKKLKDMQEEAQSAQDRIAELNAEIAREKGDTAAADRLKLELEQRQALAEIEANLAKARNEQNAELIRLYEEQKRKLQELYDLKERNLEQDIKTQQQEANAAKTANATSGGSSSTATTSPPKTGTTASGGGGINVTVNAPNAYYLDPKAANDLARSLKPALDDLNRRLA